VAVEAIMGQPSVFDPRAIPAVVFTDPELAWCGLTENDAKQQGRQHKVVSFPWQASGRATTLDRNDGLTKIIVDPHTEQVLGVGICGVGAGEMIAEGTLAVEMAARISDLKLTIHAHPTLSETMMEASEIFFGHATHVLHKR
jgi:dihydrolipoamide dehydrogenase